MMKTFRTLVASGLVAFLASASFGLGGDHPAGRPVGYSPDWPKGLADLINSGGRTGGYFVNANDTFFFAGDANACNRFLADYSKLTGTPLSLTLAPGKGQGVYPWDNKKVEADWQIYVNNRAWTRKAADNPGAAVKGYDVTIVLWTGGNVALDKLHVPLNVDVSSWGGHPALAAFVAAHQEKQLKAGQGRPDWPKLTLSIRCPAGDLRAGDEIPVEFTITNVGDKPYAYMDRNYDRSGRMDEYMLSATDEAGRPVADPRAKYAGGIGGGLCSEAKLAPGASFTKTIALNRWALVRNAGRCEVRAAYLAGHFSEGPSRTFVSAPISITVKPRTAQELTAYIDDLTAKLRALPGSEGRDVLVQKLMYTCDMRIVSALIDSMYKPGGGFWEGEAFMYYLDDRDAMKRAILAEAAKRGLASGMIYILQRSGVTAEELFPLIERSLAADSPQTWSNGACAAQSFLDPRHNPRLIAIALDAKADVFTREIAARVLAWSRTDEGVAALKKLLDDPDERIRKSTAKSVRNGYENRARGGLANPPRDEDFPEEFRKAKSPRAMNNESLSPNHYSSPKSE